MLNTILSYPIKSTDVLICLGAALILGIFSALLFSYKRTNTNSFTFSLVLLPVTMCMIIMAINGNLGIAVSVAGSFTLVRFRSVAGNGREISAIFTVMAIGVITGMGYIACAVIFFAVVAVAVLLINSTGFLYDREQKILKVTMPDSDDYCVLLDDIFKGYNVKTEIERVKTTNLGSLIEVTYSVRGLSKEKSKEFIDRIRTRNANLEISLTTDTYNYERL